MSGLEVETARITIRRVIDADGRDLVYVDQDNGDGDELPVIEALGLLQMAVHDILHPEEFMP
jgi:hypothetical protein